MLENEINYFVEGPILFPKNIIPEEGSETSPKPFVIGATRTVLFVVF